MTSFFSNKIFLRSIGTDLSVKPIVWQLFTDFMKI
jgi:hypothetical protein